MKDNCTHPTTAMWSERGQSEGFHHQMLHFKWKRAAQDSIVEHGRRLYLWKCYYFVTKAAHFVAGVLKWSAEFHFHASNHFVGIGTPFSNGEYLTVKWSLSEEEFAICCDYTWMSNSCSSSLITASQFAGWRGACFPLWFLHLGTKIKAGGKKKKKTCAWKMSYSWTHLIYFTHSLMFNTCFHAN